MKRRRSLLFGLGVLLTLTMAVPASAAEKKDIDTIDVPPVVTELPVEGTDSEDGEEGMDQIEEPGEKEPEVPTDPEEEKIWNWLSETLGEGEEAETKWKLVDQETQEAAEDGFYKVGDAVFCIQEGYLATGIQMIEEENPVVEESGKYYFAEEGTSPEEDGLGAMVVEAKWVNTKDNKWIKLTETGKIDETQIGWQEIEAEKWYFLNEDGTRDTEKTGLQTIGEHTYFLDEEGVLQKGFQKVEDKINYFDLETGIRQNYQGWQKLENTWYWFKEGNAATGWIGVKGTWYFLDYETGAMQTGFFTDTDGKKYYLSQSGAMLNNGWQLVNGKWYWMQKSGEITTGWIRPNGKTWYYLKEDGAMATAWYQVKGIWYYSNNNGAMQTGWIRPNGRTWYYLSGSGAMQTGWYKVSGKWYYSDAGGAMKTGWQKVDGKWYYLTSSGAMAANKWIDRYYYVTASGAMATSTWIGDYYVGADGKWIPNYDPMVYGGAWEKSNGKWYYKCGDGSYLKNRWQRIDNVRYYFDANGVMATGWKYIGGLKYYFKSNGALVQDLEPVMGKRSAYMATINRVKCQVTIYAQDGSNGFIIPYKTFVCSVGLPKTPTPKGTFDTKQKKDIAYLMGPSWGKWGTRIGPPDMGILFHSVACSKGPNREAVTYSLPAGEFNKLGSPASHGCVRLTVRDAKWIYDNCSLGMIVKIGDNEIATPFDKPSAPKIPATQNWDPTDPDVKR